MSYTCPYCGAITSLVLKLNQTTTKPCSGCEAKYSWTWQMEAPPKREGRMVKASEYVKGGA